jgi:tripartite-type tricarboxylate transporter receptor subunit TctC
MADIPPLADAAGLPDFEDISVWLGLVAPRGTPEPILQKLNAEVVRILSDPALREKAERTGNYPVSTTPEEFARFIRNEANRWSKVIAELNLKLD